MKRPTWLALAAAVVIGLAATLAPSAAVRPVAALGVLAVADTLTTRHDRLATVAAPGVLANDVTLLGTTAILVSPTTNGTVNLASNGGYTYNPNSGFVGTDIFRYRDSGLLTNTVNVTITVTNAAPVAVNDSYSATTGVTLSVGAPGVLANDHDADGDSMTATKVTDSGSGSVTFSSNGGFTFTSGGSFTGTRTFTYRVSDGIAWSNTATVSIHVTAPAPTPTPTPAPSTTPAPTPTPTPAPTPTSTPAPTPTLPIPTPTLPSLPSLPIPTPTLPPLPTLPIPTASQPIPTASLPIPTPSASLPPLPGTSPVPTLPGSSPTPAPGDSGAPSAVPSDSTPSDGVPPGSAGGGSPAPGFTTGGSAAGGSGGSSGTDPREASGFAIGGDDFEPFGLINEGIGVFEGLDWAVPALILTVPGLLLILAVLTQLSAGILWLPVVRRWLGGSGVGGRRRRQPN